jgi:hypothetical protein
MLVAIKSFEIQSKNINEAISEIYQNDILSGLAEAFAEKINITLDDAITLVAYHITENGTDFVFEV